MFVSKKFNQRLNVKYRTTVKVDDAHFKIFKIRIAHFNSYLNFNSNIFLCIVNSKITFESHLSFWKFCHFRSKPKNKYLNCQCRKLRNNLRKFWNDTWLAKSCILFMGDVILLQLHFEK